MLGRERRGWGRGVFGDAMSRIFQDEVIDDVEILQELLVNGQNFHLNWSWHDRRAGSAVVNEISVFSSWFVQLDPLFSAERFI